jgi:hypothetical protein
LDEKELQTKIDELADTEVQLDLIIAEKETLKKSLIPEEIQMEMESVEFEYVDKIKAVEDNIKVRKDQLKALLMEYAKPLKSKYYTWTYKEGDPIWDTKGLDGFAVSHPEMLFLRKEGKPVTKLTPVRK